MKKSTKILGSVALSAALVMGTAAPAFAEQTTGTAGQQEIANNGTTSGTGNENGAKDITGSTGTGSTTVNISTYTSQISVELPLNITFALDTKGGQGYAPDNYTIKNKTVVPIYVTKAEVKAIPETENGTDWKYGLGTDAMKTNIVSKQSGSIGDVYAEFKPTVESGDTESTASETMFIKAADSATSFNPANQALTWKIGAKPTGSAATYNWNGNTNPYTDFASLKAAVATAAGALSGVISAETVTDLTTLNDAIDTVNSYNASLNLPYAESAGGKDYTALGFDIKAYSSVLTNAAATTNNAAQIVYTVGVTAPATSTPSGN